MFALLKTAFSLFIGGNTLIRIGAYVVAGLAVAGSLWIHGYMSGRSSADHKALLQKISRLESALHKTRSLQEAHQNQVSRDDAADQKNKELINETPENPLLCFGPDHLDRLRQLR